MKTSILVDAREFVPGRRTGIGRVLEGLVGALARHLPSSRFVLALFRHNRMPENLLAMPDLESIPVPDSFLKSERALSALTRGPVSLFISPYPKLPLFGCHSLACHMIHDVLDLTHPAYRHRFKAFFDAFRVRVALKRAELTWYVSHWSRTETQNLFGFVGRNPRVRHSAVEESFSAAPEEKDPVVLKRYGLRPGYIIIVGNALPHKNLGVILDIAKEIGRPILCIGANRARRRNWESRFPRSEATWIEHVPDEELPALLRSAFCLVQPSTAEGYGYPPLEAMACGVPAVISKIPVLVETTGGYAVTADPHDPLTWIEALRALEDNHFYREMSGKGLRWVGPLQGANAWRDHISDIEDLMERD
ncbi:MAG: glycosyltransferase family 4 protein [Deltaproteobacteria bacterium]|nr:glycosyltransferase family 4 protein [Deltaproteobacteria bacterium]